MIDREGLIDRFGELLPLAAQWAREKEKRILRDGLPLDPHSLHDARALGVLRPDRVRWLKVECIPRPETEILKAACDAIDFLGPGTQGLTLGYGIFIRHDCAGVRALMGHELVHVAQYERLGGIEAFLQQYLMECLSLGYEESPLEREAIAQSAHLL
jgi:hypothetical protein